MVLSSPVLPDVCSSRSYVKKSKLLVWGVGAVKSCAQTGTIVSADHMTYKRLDTPYEPLYYPAFTAFVLGRKGTESTSNSMFFLKFISRFEFTIFTKCFMDIQSWYFTLQQIVKNISVSYCMLISVQ